MDRRKLSVIGIVVLAVIACSAAYAVQQDNVIEIDNFKFNVANVTEFVDYAHEDNESYVLDSYVDANETGYIIFIFNCSEMNESDFDLMYSDAVEYESNSSSANQTVDGLVVFSVKADTGEHIGEPRYSTFVKHDDLKMIVFVSTPDVNETVKIASTLEFN